MGCRQGHAAGQVPCSLTHRVRGMTHLGALPMQTVSIGSTGIKVLNPDVTNVVGESFQSRETL